MVNLVYAEDSTAVEIQLPLTKDSEWRSFALLAFTALSDGRHRFSVETTLGRPALQFDFSPDQLVSLRAVLLAHIDRLIPFGNPIVTPKPVKVRRQRQGRKKFNSVGELMADLNSDC